MSDRISSKWNTSNIENVCKEIYRYPTYYGIEYVEEGIPEVRGELLKSGGTIDADSRSLRYISKETAKKFPRTALEEDDIVMSVRGTIGKIGIVPKKLVGANITANLLRLSPDESVIDKEYFKQFLISGKFNLMLDSITSATTIKTLKVPDLRALEVPLPHLKEQQKIAAILTSVDETIKKTEAILKQTEKVKMGLMQHLLTKGIGHTEFKEAVIGGGPEEWKLGKLKDYSAHITKGATPTTYGFDWVADGVLFLRNECIKKRGLNLKGSAFISEEAHKTMKRSITKKGDILISITGNLGQSCIYNLDREANINQHIARIRITDQNIIPEFIKYYLNSGYMRKQYELIRTGLAYPQLSLKQIQDIVFPIPSIKEQRKIVDILSSIEDKEDNEKKKLIKYKVLKRGLTQDLLTGKVRVNVGEFGVVSS